MYFGGFPFDFSGGFGGQGRSFHQEQEAGDNEKYYNLLGVSKDADTNTIKKAYRKLALSSHPDRGGDAETFKLISTAYETLSDPEKRKLYDKYGDTYAEQGGSGGHDHGDIFGFGGSRGAAREKRGEDVVHTLKATLSQLYVGFTKNMQLRKKVLCRTCDGLGAPKTSFKECGKCKGTGRVVTVTRMGPMLTQSASACGDCRGAGNTLTGKKCGDCDGAGKTTEKKVLEVFVPKNAADKHKIVFNGEGDENKGETPGDVVFIIQEEKHAVFTRKGDNLFMNSKITLVEALTGVKQIVTQLDGRKILICSQPGQVITPGSHMAVKDEGMPRRANPVLKGDLIVTFEIVFPLTLTPENIAALQMCLPAPTNKVVEDESSEVHYMTVADKDVFDAKHSKAANEAYDEDDEDYEDTAQPKVQCQQA